MYMPAKFKIRFLEPVDLSALRPGGRRRPGPRPAHRGGGPRPASSWSWTAMRSLRADPSGSARVAGRSDREGKTPRGHMSRCRRDLRSPGCGDEDFKNEPRAAGRGRAHGRDPEGQGHGVARAQPRRRAGSDHDLQPDRRARTRSRSRAVGQASGGLGWRPPTPPRSGARWSPAPTRCSAGSEEAVPQGDQAGDARQWAAERKSAQRDLLLP